LPNCPQGISAVKALGLAAAQGQKIYTITPEVYAANPNIVNTALGAHSVDTKRRVQRALDSGMEVTIHQAPIVESGWKGAGFTSVDPATGAGGYSIEGGMNGSWLYLVATFAFALLSLGILAAFGPAAILGYGWMLSASIASAGKYLDVIGAEVNWPAISNWISLFLTIISVATLIPSLGVALAGPAIIFSAITGLITGIYSILQ